MDKGILVVGGGISGITAAVEAAEAGHSAVIVEKNPYLGGRVAQLFKYFPKLCPPYCGLEINFKRIRQSPKVQYHTSAEVEGISGGEGNFTVKVKVNPRFVNEKCTGCGKCVEACPVERPNDFNLGMDRTKAIYLPHEMAFPFRFAIDARVCKGTACAKCVPACAYGAIDLNQKAETKELNVGSIVFATGWNPYDATKMDNLGFVAGKNVITNVMMERLSAPNGPTKGKIVRPSDGKEVKSIAFVQCAGSRDENHLPYCSAICCMASLKQATYVREKNADSRATVFYIDLRTPGKYEDFLTKVSADENITLLKGKVAKIEHSANGDVVVTAEDIVAGKKVSQTFDMVVLATGMEPAAKGSAFLPSVKTEENSFILTDGQNAGMCAAGVAHRPNDVVTSNQEGTGAALRSIQSLVRR